MYVFKIKDLKLVFLIIRLYKITMFEKQTTMNLNNFQIVNFIFKLQLTY